MKILSAILISILVFSCSTQIGKISNRSNFKISKNTDISIQCDSDKLLGADLESELLGMGFNVVPYETAINAVSVDSNLQKEGDKSIKSNSDIYNITYIPSRIVLNINVSIHKYPFASYFLGGNIRIIDLVDKKLLASFSYKGNELTLYNPEKIIELFIEDFSKFVEND